MSEVTQAAGEPLVLFVIYERGRCANLPDHYSCVRMFCLPGEEWSRAEKHPLFVGTTLDIMRAHLMNLCPNLTNVGHCEGDEPQVLETWL